MIHKNKISAYSKRYYVSHRDERLEQFSDYHHSLRDKRLEEFSDYHYSHRDKRLEEFSDYHYSHHDERTKQFSDYYASYNQKVKDSAKEHYMAVADIKNAKLRQKYRLCQAKCTKHVSPCKFKAILKKKRNRTYYKKNSKKLKENKRARYALNLSEPKHDMKQKYIALIRKRLEKNDGVQKQLKVAFNVDCSLPIRVTQSGINLMASRRLVNLILSVRKHCAGLLLGVIKKVKNHPCISNGHFGEQYHLASSVPYFYQACYKDAPSSDNCNNDVNIDDNVIDNIVKDNIDVVDDNVTEKNGDSNMDKDDKNNCNSKGNKKGAVKLPCNENCKALTDSETDSIAKLKEAFSKPIEFRNALKNVDSGCPNEHNQQNNGHPLICSVENGGCKSTLQTSNTKSCISSLSNALHFSA